MVMYNNAPENLRGATGANGVVWYKGKQFILSRLQSEVFITLSDGNKHSSHNLMRLIHTSDPRKEVQRLREKGINVQGEWVKAVNDIPRHKIYFIDPNECKEEVNNEC